MKVGILSMQRIANYGSYLQAYALKKLLEQKGVEVEFVDYHIGAPLIAAEAENPLVRKIKKAKEAFSYGAPLKETIKYVKYKKNFGTKYTSMLGVGATPNYNPELDLLVIGSDEVFNCVQANPNVGYSPELFGKDNKAKKLVSYAASFGNTTLDKLKEYGVYDEVSALLGDFNSISVRDNNSYKIVAEMGLKPQIHLDPVLTYDFSKEKQSDFKVPDYKYLILYGYSGRFSDEECAKVSKYAKEHNLKIINIGGIQKACDEFVDCQPEEVISMFRNAECVITDTFHGSILSIITERPFAVYVRSKGYGNNEKLEDLLERLSLKEQIVENNDFAAKLEQKINWNEVNEIINSYRKKADEYLDKCLSVRERYVAKR